MSRLQGCNDFKLEHNICWIGCSFNILRICQYDHFCYETTYLFVPIHLEVICLKHAKIPKWIQAMSQIIDVVFDNKFLKTEPGLEKELSKYFFNEETLEIFLTS